MHAYAVLAIKPQGKVLLMQLKGLTAVEDAEAYRGAAVYISKESLRREGGDEYFWYEILGLRVFLDTGEYLGCVSEIIPTGGNDIYIVRKGKAEIHIPAVHDVVKEIDTEGRRLVISPMEGLLEVNEV
jgi:16S rRNA processing protein RimM